jgi:hypothetical protein
LHVWERLFSHELTLRYFYRSAAEKPQLSGRKWIS